MERLHIESSLEALQLSTFAVDCQCLGQAVFRAFEDNPMLPGVVLLEQQQILGMISRRGFLEAMSRAYGRELFLRRSLKVLYGFVGRPFLQLPSHTRITEAARMAVDRPSELLYEPIVVELPATSSHQETAVRYCLLDMHDLLQAQSTIYQLTVELLQEKTRSEMMQTEKMASLGKMMAGVAHEIRNPVNFIWGNLKYINEYSEDLTRLVPALVEEVPAPSQSLKKLLRQIDVSFVLEDLPKILSSIETGTERLRNLVASLRTFSRLDEVKRYPTDLHQSLDSTLLILNNRLKEGVTVKKEYGELPIIPCYTGQIGQVFMNIISNAIDALLEYDASLAQSEGLSQHYKSGLSLVPNRPWEPCITIHTAVKPQLPPDATEASAHDGDWISIRIIDNGPGIPEDIQRQVFDDFFTTKPVGQGTGLGLPITRQIVQDKHQGRLLLRSPCLFFDEQQPGRGTEFEILLPVVDTDAMNGAEAGRGRDRASDDTVLAR